MSVPLLALQTLLVLQIAQPQLNQEATPSVWGYSVALSRDDYILGPGDVLNVVVEGGCNDVMLMAGLLPSAICRVSGDGSLQMPGVGQLSVDGLSIEESQHRLQLLARRYYPGLRIGLSLIEPRLISVWISGMVNTPGRYPLHSIHRVSDLVLAAGGIAPFGSRWGTMHMPDGSVAEIDLSFGADGQPANDPYIVNGASVVIPPVSRPVFVLRPGEVLLASDGTLIEGSRNHVEAWDVLEGETIPGFLQRMGGPDGRVDLTGTALISAGLQTPVWTSEEGFIRQTVLPGDTLRLAVLGNHVYVAGAVHNPGSVLYQSGMTVQQCIDMAGGAQNAGRTGRTLLSRNGAVLARGGSALAMNARPGDVIEVPYSVESRYQTSIVILASLVTMTATIINLTRN